MRISQAIGKLLTSLRLKQLALMGSDTIRGLGGDDVLNGGFGFFTEIQGALRAANDNRFDGRNGVGSDVRLVA